MSGQHIVLIVDDDEPTRALLARWILRWDYQIREAAGAQAALEIMEREPIDILVSDISMPEYDGLWLAEQVRERWPRVSVIMGTAYDNPDVIYTSQMLGAVAFVTKPFDRDLLRQAIDRASGRLQFRPSATRPT